MGATYDQILAVAKETERLGFDAFFRSDHLLAFDPEPQPPGSTDAWITLGGLARETRTSRLGTRGTPATFRYPGPLAIPAAPGGAGDDGDVPVRGAARHLGRPGGRDERGAGGARAGHRVFRP